ncbi:ERAD-associated E3 ubiquitin-protein ligase hrd1 [Orchesella cincta]|uniref:ERAD-associated E3 ubiquitin-protein ligase hrd1 n=1 Tax=Orchesella cincta TaxID=48709 RepID=A0A1D2N2H4_ORCCI|nr:ERAD-associated E3 ubiquitin-protein ligase hrd1 [Orchesella cincta]
MNPPSINRLNILCNTPCGHVFHRHCLEEWIRENENCPTCRRQVVQEDLYPLFLQADNRQRNASMQRIAELEEQVKQEKARADMNEVRVEILEKILQSQVADQKKTTQSFKKKEWQDWRIEHDYFEFDDYGVESPGTGSPPAAKKAKLSGSAKNGSPAICITPCGHVYHRVCLLGWLKKCGSNGRKGNCPACRHRFAQESLYPVYLEWDKKDKTKPSAGGHNSKAFKQSKIDPCSCTRVQCQDLHQRHGLLTQDYEEMGEKFRQEKERADTLAAKLQSLEQEQHNKNNATNANVDEEEYDDEEDDNDYGTDFYNGSDDEGDGEDDYDSDYDLD